MGFQNVDEHVPENTASVLGRYLSSNIYLYGYYVGSVCVYVNAIPVQGWTGP
jgi:hypothetical protein